MLAMIKVNVPKESETKKGVQGMDEIKQLKTVNSSNATQTSLPSVSMRELFLNWLVDGNAKKYSVEVILSCLDKISDYAIKKRISVVSFWEYMQFNAFKPVYNKLLEAKLLRVTDRSTYKVFIVAGQLYLKFLKEKPWVRKVSLADEGVSDTVAKEQIDVDNQPVKTIDPEDVIAWLVTQPNTNGTLYLENVVRQYMRNLRSAPMRLSYLSLDSRDVFACRTVAELNELWSIFKTAPNYKKVNSTTSGMFSAGLGVYRRYLENLAAKSGERIDVQLVAAPKQEIGSFYSDILMKTLEEHFSNGLRSNSPIEMRRFRRFVMEDYGEEIMLSDEVLTKLILSYGTLFEGKVYIIQTDATERIKNEIDSAIMKGIEVIFYSSFYEQNEDWLFPASIISEEMFKNLLMSLYPQFIYKMLLSIKIPHLWEEFFPT